MLPKLSRDISVDMSMDYGLDYGGIRVFLSASKQAVGSIQPPIRWVLEDISSESWRQRALQKHW
jgi:hypothetical protein